MTVISRRRADTQDRLLDSALVAIAERGVLGASVEDICEHAGFTRGAFYSNFDTKDSLCVALLNRHGERIARAVVDAVSQLPAPPAEHQCLEDVIDLAMTAFQASRPVEPTWLLARQELRLYAVRSPSVRGALMQAEFGVQQLIIEAISTALESQHASLALPVDRALALLDAYGERLAMEAMLGGQEPGGDDWSVRMAALLLTLIDHSGPPTDPA